MAQSKATCVKFAKTCLAAAFALAVAAGATLPALAYTVTDYWTGATSDKWNNAGNWRWNKDGNGTSNYPAGTGNTKYAVFSSSYIQRYTVDVTGMTDGQYTYKGHLAIGVGTEAQPLVISCSNADKGPYSDQSGMWFDLGYSRSSDYYAATDAVVKFSGGTYGPWQAGTNIGTSDGAHYGHLILDGQTVATTFKFGNKNDSNALVMYSGRITSTNADVVCNGYMRIASAANATGVVDKVNGNWQLNTGTDTNGRLYLGYQPGTRAEFYHRGGSLITSSYICIGAFQNSDTTQPGTGYAYFELDGGIVSNKTNTIIISDKAGEPGDLAVLRVKSGTLAANGDMRVGGGYSGILQIDGGEVDVSRGNITVAGGAEGEDSAVILSNGVLKVRQIAHVSNAAANGTILLDGGTLQAAQSGTLIAAADNLAVNVGGNGANIATGDFDVEVAEPLNAVDGAAGDLTVTGGGTATFSAVGDLTGAFDVGDGTTLHWFDQDGAASTYTLSSLTIGEGSTIYLNPGDSFGSTPVTLNSTGANKANIEVAFTAGVPAGTSYALFGAAAGDEDKVTVTPTLGSLTLPHEVAIADGMLTLTITAEDYTWKNTETNWDDADAWTKGGADATWSDGNNAIFSTAGATATLAANAAASEVRFTADANVDGSGTLSVSKVTVDSGVSATISAPISGAFEKVGPGSLTLGQSRSAQTTVSAGTLAMPDGVSIAPANLTLGTDSTPVAFDYGGQTLDGDPTAYFTAGADVTLTNGVFRNTGDITFTLANLPARLTIAKGAELSTSTRWIWNSLMGSAPGADNTNVVNIAGGIARSESDGNNWIMQNTRSGTFIFNVTDGGLLEFGGLTHILACRDSTTENDKVRVFMTFNDSTLRVGHNANIWLNGDYQDSNRKNPPDPIFELAMTNSCFDVGTGCIKLGHNATRSNTAGHATADFENCVITAKQFAVYHERPANAARFNNSTLVLSADYDYSLEARDEFKTLGGEWEGAIPVAIGPGGLTIDTQTYSGHMVADPQGEGALVKTGSGKLTLDRDQTATAPLIVGNGTLVVNAGLSVARPTTVASGATLKTSGAATLSGGLTLADGATLDVSGAAAVATSATLPESVTVALTKDGGAFAKGLYPILTKTGVTVAEVEGKLVPTLASGATSYEWLVKDGTLYLAVDMDLTGFVWTGAAGDGKMSTDGNWWNGSEPGAGDAVNFSGVTAATTIDADIDATFGVVTMGSGVVTFTGSLTATSFSDTAKVAVGANAIVTVDGDLMFTATSSEAYAVYRVNTGGKFIVTGRLGLASGSTKVFYPQVSPGTGVVVAGSLVNDGGNHIEAALDDNATTQHWAIGPGGVTGTTTTHGIWVLSNNKLNPEFQPWTNDFTVTLWTCLRENAKSFTYNTTGLDDLGHTITLDAGFSDKTAPLYVTGTGKVVVNHVTKSFGGKNAYSGPVTVTNSATLAINAGKKLTSGKITVNSGATLELAESGTNTLGGALSLQDGATLKFNFTERRNPPVLDLTGKAVTFGNETNITVSVVGERPAYHAAPGGNGRYALTSGYDFSTAGATIARAGDCPAWVKSIGLDDSGNIVADILLNGFLVIVN